MTGEFLIESMPMDCLKSQPTRFSTYYIADRGHDNWVSCGILRITVNFPVQTRQDPSIQHVSQLLMWYSYLSYYGVDISGVLCNVSGGGRTAYYWHWLFYHQFWKWRELGRGLWQCFRVPFLLNPSLDSFSLYSFCHCLYIYMTDATNVVFTGGVIYALVTFNVLGNQEALFCMIDHSVIVGWGSTGRISCPNLDWHRNNEISRELMITDDGYLFDNKLLCEILGCPL